MYSKSNVILLSPVQSITGDSALAFMVGSSSTPQNPDEMEASEYAAPQSPVGQKKHAKYPVATLAT